MSVSESVLLEVIDEVKSEIGATFFRKLRGFKGTFDLDDVLQMTAQRAIQSRERCQAESREEVANWVHKVARTCAWNSYQRDTCDKRSVDKTISYDDRLNQPTYAPIDSLVIQDELEQVRSALKDIPRKQAIAVEMLYLEMMEYPEVAAKLNCTIQAARSLVSRGLAAVREIIAKQSA